MKDKIRLTAEKWVNNGFTISHADGMPVFIKGLIPGETGECIITKKNAKFIHVNALEVITPSPERIKSDCPVFPECGGCSFRHISYENELETKKGLLLENIKNLPQDKIEILAASGTNYRNNVQMKIDRGEIGFYKTGTNEIVPLPANGCLNLADELNEFIIENRQGFSLSFKKEIRLRLTAKGISEYSDAESHFTHLDFSLMVPRNGFYQINRFLIEPWLNKIRDYAPAVKHIVEFFSGAGIISLALKEKYQRLTGYELDRESVKYAEKNARDNGLGGTQFLVKNLYEQKFDLPAAANLWIFNPPRNGLNKLIIEQIQKYQPDHILYSSCNYITLARDLKELDSMYITDKVSLIDFFPRTPYFETLVKLEKRKK